LREDDFPFPHVSMVVFSLKTVIERAASAARFLLRAPSLA
jgi:hypothetical protein